MVYILDCFTTMLPSPVLHSRSFIFPPLTVNHRKVRQSISAPPRRFPSLGAGKGQSAEERHSPGIAHTHGSPTASPLLRLCTPPPGGV